MIVLTVLSYNGAPADGPSAQFDELGGTIGRADNNQLVLPDPERTISRVHARLVFRAGKYAIVDNGSNPINVNGTPVGAGREHPLQPGDELQIGGYVLKAGAVALGAAAADPFADLFGDAAMGLAAPPSSAKPMPPAPASAPAAPAWRPPAPAPMASPPAAWLAPPPAPAPALAVGHIPEDWDPFAPDPVADQPPPTAAAPAGHAIFDLPRGGGDSIDDLFDLSGAPSKADPLGASPSHANQAAPNMAAHDDPLQSLASAGSADLPSRSDHFSDLNTPMPLAPTPPAPTAAPLPAGAVFSWNDPPRDGRVVTLPGVRRPGEEPPATMAAAAPAAAPMPPSIPAPTPAWPAARPPAAASGDQGELLAALLAGLGTPDLRVDALTPATMELIGQLLRESMRGTVELLVARAALKREMRAEMTMIVARENNPLKFSPTVEVALQHLLGPQTPGFMAPAPAVRDAYDDLRAHQLGVMAGMRAALDGVLQRFDPRQLEGKLTHRSAISTLIPATRKAKLWESFQELFTQLQAEAQDDFDELFGRAFLRAYEDQLDRMSGEPGPR